METTWARSNSGSADGLVHAKISWPSDQRKELSTQRASESRSNRAGVLRMLSATAALVILTTAVGCGKQPPAAAEHATPPETTSPTPEARIATTDHALEKLKKNSGLAVASATKVFAFGDGGVSDPSIGFYEWVIFSPTPLEPPTSPSTVGKQPLNLPLKDSVQFAEAKLGGGEIENAQAAFSLGWQTNAFDFSGTWIRTLDGDYLIVQQVRNH